MTLPAFDNEEANLLNRLAEIRKAKEEILRSWDLAISDNELWDACHTPFYLGMFQIEGMTFYLKPSRPIESEKLSQLPGYKYTDYIAVSALEWPKFMEFFDKDEIRFKEGLKEKFLFIMKGPHYIIDESAAKKSLEVFVSDFLTSNLIRRIDGFKLLHSDYKSGVSKYQIPTNQGYNLFSLLTAARAEKGWPASWIEWRENAYTLVLTDINQRSEIDKIAMLDKADFDPQFPTGLKLKDFQTVGALFLDTVGRGMLGHQPGLGKSPMAIAASYKNQDYTLVVCPAALRLNWARQIHKFTGEHAMVVSGEIPATHTSKAIVIDKPTKWVIISYDAVASCVKSREEIIDEKGNKKTEERQVWPWAFVINLAKFDRIIFDESHYLKNPATARAKGALQLVINKLTLLSGTPIINRPREAFIPLKLINPELFNNYEGFIYQWERHDGSCSNPKAFKEMLKPFMLRKLKSEVQKELPPINRIDEVHELSPLAQSQYDRAEAGVYEEINRLTGQKTNEMNIVSILAMFTRLKQICSYDKFDHAADVAREYYDETEGKVIIFSQFVDTVMSIAKLLGGEAVTMTGVNEQEDRMKIMDSFQKDPNVHFICCTSQVAREGLDLDTAKACIFVDPLWAPAYHEQCEGRAYGRLSNEHSIDSYYLNANGTIEDLIADIRARKFALVSGTIDDLNSARNASMGSEFLEMWKNQMGKKAWKAK